MIRVPVMQHISQNNVGLIFSDSGNQLKLMSLIIFKKPISHFQVFPNLHPQYCRSSGSFLVAGFYCATGAQFALCKIDNANLFTSFDFV